MARKCVWMGAFLLGLFLVSGASRAGEEGDLRIGCLYPLSGDVAPIGQNIKRGIDLAVDDINAAGGVSGRKLVIVWGDSQGDPKVGMSEAERLITREKVPCMLGAYQSAVTEVVSQVAERYQTPLVTAMSTANILTTRGYKYFFRLQGTNMGFLKSMVLYADAYNKEKLGGKLKTVAIVADNTLLGQETLEWSKYWAKELGYDVIAEVLYSKGTPDLTSEVLALRSAKPDILIADSYITDAILLVKTMIEQNFKPAIFVTKGTGFIDPSFIPNVGAIANGITSTVEWSPDMIRGAETNKRFRERFGVEMNGHSVQAYTGIWLLKTAIEKAGSTDRNKIRDTLENIVIENKFPNGPDLMVAYDKISFTTTEINGIKHTNLNPNTIQAISQIQDGKYVTVWPFSMTKSETIYPAPYK